MTTRPSPGRWLLAALGLALLGGCSARATTDPSESNVATALGHGACQVRIENATAETLELNYQTGTRRVPVGVAEPGNTYEVSVPCDETRFWVQGVGVLSSETGFDQFRKGAELTPGREAVVKLTEGDRIRRRDR